MKKTRTITELAGSIEEAIKGKSQWEDEFPKIASEALVNFEPEQKLTESWLTEFLLQDDEKSPRQNAANKFGDPPINLYVSERFYMEALVWWPSSTSIHGHGFCGAFKVMQGISLQAQYHFQPYPKENNLFFKEGDLRIKQLELLKPGDVFPIHPFESFIHAVSHLGLPSITLVVRNPANKNEENLFKQYQYFHQGLAVLNFYNEALYKRQLDLIFLHLKTLASWAVSQSSPSPGKINSISVNAFKYFILV